MTASGSTSDVYVIVGGGLAGAKAAQTLRREGFLGRVVLLAAEQHRPYERPPLSKAVLAGSAELETVYVHPPGWYDEQDVELRLGARVVHLDPAAHEVVLSDGQRLTYTKLLLATGAAPRRLRVPGADLAGVHYLRDITDAEALRGALASGDRQVVIVGGGWIGLETAAAARGYGNAVTIVEHEPTPLYATLGPELGSFFAQLHEEHGVALQVGASVAGFRGEGGRITSVVTANGHELPADVAIVGVGVSPDIELAEKAGLLIDNGIVVDQTLQTSDPDVYAAGDVANAYNPLLGRQLRVEHWDNARKSGAAAARAMVGQTVSYDPVPYFFTDQYDLGMEFSGSAAPGDFDRIVYRGDVAARQFIAFWLSGRRVVAGMNVNVWDVAKPIARLIRTGIDVDDQQLRDLSCPLDAIAPTPPLRAGGGAA